MTAQKILAIDTSVSVCAAVVYDGEIELGRNVIELGKGHAEHLMAVIDKALQAAGTSFRQLDRIAVAIGPGSFTGIRVGVATARGLALALKVPAIGISNLEAIADEARGRNPGRAILAALGSPERAVQAAVYDPFAKLVYHPAVMTAALAARLASDHNAVVSGSASAAIAALNPQLRADGGATTGDIGTYARLAAEKLPGKKPRPLYLREPDAKPQLSFGVARAAS